MTEYIAKYFDGKSSQVHILNYELGDECLILKTAGDDTIWQFKNILVVERPHDSRPAVLSFKKTPDARLLIDDNKVYESILHHIPKRNIQIAHVQHSWRVLFLAMLLIAAFLGFAVFGVPYYAPWLAKSVPHKWDDNLGKWVIQNVSGKQKVCVSEDGLKALRKIENRLVQNHHFEQDFDIKVVNSSIPNAFAVPGYHVVIYQGLFQLATTPEAVTGVLAHEMAHSKQHHPTAGLIRDIGVSIIFAAAFGSSPDYGVKLLGLSYSRKFELEADAIGTQILNDANVSANGLKEFFETLMDKQGSIEDMTKYISTHPPSKERVQKLEELNKVNNGTPILTDAEWQSLKNICSKTKPLSFDESNTNQ